MSEDRLQATLDEIKTAIVKTATLVEERNTSAIEWRNNVCKKFDKIFEWLSELPCSERKAWYSSMNRQMLFMWGVITGMGAMVLTHILGWK